MIQYDIYGNEVEIEAEDNTHFGHLTMKDKFRLKYGFFPDRKCGDCKYHRKIGYNDKYYHKCEKIGITNSEASDIRLKDVACRLYEEEKNGR